MYGTNNAKQQTKNSFVSSKVFYYKAIEPPNRIYIEVEFRVTAKQFYIFSCIHLPFFIQ